MFLFLSTSPRLIAQWTNDPSINTKLVINSSDPINISGVNDGKGGAFIVWQDHKNNSHDAVFFMHADGNGRITFRADGKKVCDLTGRQEEPVISTAQANRAVIVWNDYSNSRTGQLVAQKVLNNGSLLWSEDGIRITQSNNLFSGYSVDCSNTGNCFVSFVAKEPSITGNYSIKVQKIGTNGNLLFNNDSSTVYSSRNRKSKTSIIADNQGGAVIFWLENQDDNSSVYVRHIDSTDHNTWAKQPLKVSGENQNVIGYKAQRTGEGNIYIAWQIQQDSEKHIYHQLISTKGKFLWKPGGRIVTSRKGNQFNPEVFCTGSYAILSWTNELKNDDNIIVQKFDNQGKPLWRVGGVPVIKINGEQFGQKITGDGKQGVIVSWIDRRVDTLLANIYAQRINSQGKPVWDSTGIAVASNKNTLKSYLSIVSDLRGGSIVIFKNKRDNNYAIYGQKIFNSGTYVSQIIGFQTRMEGDSVKISWYAANEVNSSSYEIERTTQTDTGSTYWIPVKNIESSGKGKNNFYQYYDVPDVSGTIYYRVVQKDGKGNIQVSNVARVDYLKASSNIIIAQNNPNPFSDSTKINFYLPSPSLVTIEFFDNHVNKITEIKNKKFPEGQNAIIFSANGLSPGIYFYRFKTKNFVDVKKMVITN